VPAADAFTQFRVARRRQHDKEHEASMVFSCGIQPHISKNLTWHHRDRGVFSDYEAEGSLSDASIRLS